MCWDCVCSIRLHVSLITGMALNGGARLKLAVSQYTMRPRERLSGYRKTHGQFAGDVGGGWAPATYCSLRA